MERIPITVEQFRAALTPDDFADHEVTTWDAMLMGLGCENPTARARFAAWMGGNGWTVAKQAAGCIRWDSDHGPAVVWLDAAPADAASQMVRVLRGGHDPRPGLEILDEIAATAVSEDDVEAAEELTGGGLFAAMSTGAVES